MFSKYKKNSFVSITIYTHNIVDISAAENAIKNNKEVGYWPM